MPSARIDGNNTDGIKTIIPIRPITILSGSIELNDEAVRLFWRALLWAQRGVSERVLGLRNFAKLRIILACPRGFKLSSFQEDLASSQAKHGPVFGKGVECSKLIFEPRLGCQLNQCGHPSQPIDMPCVSSDVGHHRLSTRLHDGVARTLVSMSGQWCWKKKFLACIVFFRSWPLSFGQTAMWVFPTSLACGNAMSLRTCPAHAGVLRENGCPDWRMAVPNIFLRVLKAQEPPSW